MVVCAAGSLPGDLHKLWRTRDPKGYHLEYGYSCMGYEIAGGLGVKMAAAGARGVRDGRRRIVPDDGAGDSNRGAGRATLTILLLDNHGFSSIGGLSQSVGCDGFGTHYRRRSGSGELDGSTVDIDFVANAASMGAHAERAASREEITRALGSAKQRPGVSVIVIPVDREQRVGGYDSWWDVPVAEVSPLSNVQRARETYEDARRRLRDYL